MRIKRNGEIVEVRRADYITAKTKQLIEFGYAGLTEADVNEQLDAVQEGKKFGKGLTAIGVFMRDDLAPPSDNAAKI